MSGQQLDAEALLAFLDERRATSHLLVGAVYDGLAERIRAGEFDAEADTQT